MDEGKGREGAERSKGRISGRAERRGCMGSTMREREREDGALMCAGDRSV